MTTSDTRVGIADTGAHRHEEAAAMARKETEVRHGPLDGVVRVEALRRFSEVVRELGGDPLPLLAKAQIDPAALSRTEAVISYRSMIHLLERTAVELDCPDFGLRLAARQGGAAVLGPLEVAMRNSTTVGEAYRYCAGHLQVYSPVVRIQIEDDRANERHFMRFEILLGRVPHQRQAVENALGLTHHAVLAISSGQARSREIWFTHERAAPMAVFQKFFGAPVRFGQPFNAVFFSSRDLALPIHDPNPQLYQLASTYIDTQFPAAEIVLATRVREIAGRLLATGLCTHHEVATRMGLHPRTLQRRLREEDTSFEAIKDEVRRDAALRHLSQSTIPFTRVAALLGYSEPSVLTRSCQRWFSRSPRQIRESLGRDLEIA
ncbi:MAG TPA: AraC family transcriptional regulator ligand-binding domain-containing protein [Nevskiaceae bacterium]|nr:AraC family transcriptional regulator ligand-binding domain-containing protein [Nevskiaceae bacterium]